MVLGAAIILVKTAKAPAGAAAAKVEVVVDEILSYECARSIASITHVDEQTGPVFAQGNLVFTSMEASDASTLLIVNAGNGNFMVNLEGSGVNRIRFELPTAKRGQSNSFFLSYMHGGTLRSRYFDYSEDKPPQGRDELDYSLMPVRRADNLLPHLDYAISETAEATLNAITDGKLERAELAHHRIENCEHISRTSPSLGNSLRHKLDQIDLIVMGPRTSVPLFVSRLPASN
jgi:hypothetical protein